MSDVKVIRLSTGEDVIAKLMRVQKKLLDKLVIIPNKWFKLGSINDEFIQCVWEGEKVEVVKTKWFL